MRNLWKLLKKELKVIILASLVGALVGGGISFGVIKFKTEEATEEELIKNFYLTENAVYVSPHGLRKKMDKGEKSFILVDLRSPQEYEKEHIVGAINIPAYKDPNTSAYEEKERIVNSFKELPEDKEIIVYCYSMPCMTGRKVGQMLAENNLYVKHLGIGWNEWRYFWNLWNHDLESPSKMEDYVISGKEPGTPKLRDLPSPCGRSGELSC